ncbi:helix-turn-helix transcriptional regulator [Phascolarctobacterium sp.]
MLRVIHKINQYEMAQALEISQTHMSNIESGRVQIKLRLLLRAANFFYCKLDDFF